MAFHQFNGESLLIRYKFGGHGFGNAPENQIVGRRSATRRTDEGIQRCGVMAIWSLMEYDEGEFDDDMVICSVGGVLSIPFVIWVVVGGALLCELLLVFRSRFIAVNERGYGVVWPWRSAGGVSL